MRTDVVTLLLQTDRHNVPVACLRLVARLKPRCVAYRGTHYRKGIDDEQELSAAALDVHLPALLTDIVDSNRRVSIWLRYRLASGAILELEIDCNGEQYRDTWSVRLYGYLAVRFELKYLAPPQAGGVQRPPVATHPAFPGQRLTDTEELFVRIAGLRAAVDPAPLITATLLENNYFVFSPATCALVHHQTLAHFVRDLATSYSSYHRQMGLPEQLLLTRGRWDVEQNPLDCAPPRQPASISSSEEGIQELLLTTLDEARVRRLVTLPASVVLPLVHQAAQATAGVHWYDFGAHGAVVSTGDPQVWLWPFYQALLERVQPYLEAEWHE